MSHAVLFGLPGTGTLVLGSGSVDVVSQCKHYISGFLIIYRGDLNIAIVHHYALIICVKYIVGIKLDRKHVIEE